MRGGLPVRVHSARALLGYNSFKLCHFKLCNNFRADIAGNGYRFVAPVVVQKHLLPNRNDLHGVFKRQFLRNEPHFAQLQICILRRDPFCDIVFILFGNHEAAHVAKVFVA